MGWLNHAFVVVLDDKVTEACWQQLCARLSLLGFLFWKSYALPLDVVAAAHGTRARFVSWKYESGRGVAQAVTEVVVYVVLVVSVDEVNDVVY